ncbi:hypothetical protein [Streptomyces avidinii]|uniref:Uncharacterized protein n=1 Tax=Streptomyces avidinii TaxID=1895 RepID=A0ABS4LFY4_STRAV|nr:hypothetical protein [Streptomyces avidinii]MBP2041015.1 hypothetical protein [Streptomyces avidinii]GGZ05301.1 hypothetical protein GCM10010343_33760 [Streptomyces avidinii]
MGKPGLFKRPELPEGSLKALNDALHTLHLWAGRPSLSVMLQAMDASTRASRSTLHAAFTSPVLPSRDVLDSLVEVLGARARRTTPEEQIDRFDALWQAAAVDEIAELVADVPSLPVELQESVAEAVRGGLEYWKLPGMLPEELIVPTQPTVRPEHGSESRDLRNHLWASSPDTVADVLVLLRNIRASEQDEPRTGGELVLAKLMLDQGLLKDFSGIMENFRDQRESLATIRLDPSAVGGAETVDQDDQALHAYHVSPWERDVMPPGQAGHGGHPLA